VRETQRAAQRDFGVDHGQAAADVVSMDDDEIYRPLAAVPAEPEASEELLGLLAWAVEEERLDEHSAAILTTRYFDGPIGRDGVATDRQIGALIGLSQPTITRHRQRAFEQLAEAATEFRGHDLPSAG
jgi:DNA-directed RNA polymerase specialized sigma subunit